MKNIQYLFLFVALLCTGSCGKNFDDLNIDPNNPALVPADFLLTSAENSIARTDPWFYGIILSQHWAMNNYTDASRYQLNGDGTFNAFYTNPLRDLKEVITLVNGNQAAGSASSKNKVAVAKILMAYTYHSMTDIWGPIPYSEALLGDQNRSPKYDAQRDIYLGVLRDLKDAINQIDESAGGFSSADVIYGGDMGKWKKFAYSLILRVAMRMSDIEPAAARMEVEAAAPFVLSNNSDNAYFRFLSGAPNNNPINADRILRIDADLCLSNILIDNTLKPLNDPRLPAFADERLDGGGYFGRPFGQTSANAAGELPDIYSQPSGAGEIRNGTYNFKDYDVVRPEAPYAFMSYAEVCFILAEANERGWTVGGTARDWYNAGILASMEEWGVTDAAAQNAYLLQAEVDYTTAPGDWKQKIGVQKWLAMFNQGMQAWAEWRRLDFQKLELPVDGALQDVGNKVAPVRIIYPTNEQAQNSAGYDQGVSHLGGPDKLFTRLWWDVE